MAENDKTALTESQADFIVLATRIVEEEVEAIELLNKAGYFQNFDERSIEAISAVVDKRLKKLEQMVEEFKFKNRSEAKNGKTRES
jgi:hypothetical protein